MTTLLGLGLLLGTAVAAAENSFEKILIEREGKIAVLRASVEQGRRNEAVHEAPLLLNQAANLAALWKQVENEEPGSFFGPYLKMRYNAGLESGVPLDMAMRAWLGLHIGEKIQFAPTGLQLRWMYDSALIRAGDPVLLILVNGGLIRGQVLGWRDEEVVIQELLPSVLAYAQRKGSLRIVDIGFVARIELLRKFVSNKKPWDLPASPIDREGRYLSSWVRPDLARRIDLRPDNELFLQLVRDRKWSLISHKPIVTAIESDEQWPRYAALSFLDCENHLSATDDFQRVSK